MWKLGAIPLMVGLFLASAVIDFVALWMSWLADGLLIGGGLYVMWKLGQEQREKMKQLAQENKDLRQDNIRLNEENAGFRKAIGNRIKASLGKSEQEFRRSRVGFTVND